MNSSPSSAFFGGNWPDNDIKISKVAEQTLQILERAELIVNDDFFVPEPTPLGPIGALSVVQQVPVTENQWHQDECFRQILDPLLQEGGPDESHSFAKRGCTETSWKSRDYTKRTMNKVWSSSQTLPNESAIHQSHQEEPARFRRYQCDQWAERFQELVDYKMKNGDCLIPNDFPENQKLAQWVKRQRYQYKLKQLGRSSTLSQDRQVALKNMGFVWDSHKAAWDERYKDLCKFYSQMGHSNVPTNYSDRTLAIWVKCQRRQHKLYTKNGRSTMTEERMMRMNALGFDWNPRNL